MNSPVDLSSEPAEPKPAGWKPLATITKYSAVIAIMAIAFVMLKQKLAKLSWAKVMEGMQEIPPSSLLLALALTVLNYVILTGYDWIAVRYLKKKLTLAQIWTGAVIGYAMSNILGWIFGGTAVRYRLYSSWGFSIKEIVAFISILSMTFWLGMFLLAGIAFVALPVHLPAEYAEHLPLTPHALGWCFLAVVALYLLASAFYRKPIKWGDDEFALPPVQLSAMQLVVSACDFLLASAVLFVLLPKDLDTNFSTVLVTYLAAMIVVVAVHAPGGFGILEVIMIELIAPHAGDDQERLIAALVMFRVIYYFIPAIMAGIMLVWHEISIRAGRVVSIDKSGPAKGSMPTKA